MKKTLFFMLFAAVAMLTACSETNDEYNEFDNWKERNDAFYTSVYAKAKQAADNGDNSWRVIRSYSKKEGTIDATDYIVVEVLAHGTGTATPLYTDSVKMHYSGRLIPTENYAEGYLFDSSWTGDYNLSTMVPAKGKVGSFVDGFADALMNMRTGDRWRVYIPYPLGYGTADNDEIPAYSTLVFDLTLTDVWR